MKDNIKNLLKAEVERFKPQQAANTTTLETPPISNFQVHADLEKLTKEIANRKAAKLEESKAEKKQRHMKRTTNSGHEITVFQLSDKVRGIIESPPKRRQGKITPIWSTELPPIPEEW